MSSVTWTIIQWTRTSHTLWFPTINIQDTQNTTSWWTRRVNVCVDHTIYTWVWPYFPDRRLREIHMLWYSWDLYWKEVTIFPLKKLRENIKFTNKQKLTNQLHKDVTHTQEEKITALTFWTFDLFHLGHKKYLSQAKQRCDILITIVARDKNVRLLKHKQATDHEEQRLQHVLDSKIPDLAILWHHENHFACLETYTPEVLCLGYDQVWFSEGLQRFYTRHWRQLPTIVRLNPYKPDKRKTSLIQP